MAITYVMMVQVERARLMNQVVRDQLEAVVMVAKAVVAEAVAVQEAVAMVVAVAARKHP